MLKNETLNIVDTIKLAKAIEELYKPEAMVEEEIQMEELRNQWQWD